MADDARQAELRGLIAEALHRRLCAPLAGGDQPCQSCRDDADALLPIVERHAARRAAEAEAALIAYLADLTVAGKPALSGTALRLARARAAALDPTTEETTR